MEEAYRRLSANDGNPQGNSFNNFNFIGTCEKGAVGFEGCGGKLPCCDTYGMTRYVLQFNRVHEAWCSEKKYKEYTDW